MFVLLYVDGIIIHLKTWLSHMAAAGRVSKSKIEEYPLQSLVFDTYNPIQPSYARNVSFHSAALKKQHPLYHTVAEFYEMSAEEDMPQVSRFIPDACVDMTFQYAPGKVTGVVCGNYSTIIEVHREQYNLMFGIRLHPGAAPSVLGIPANKLAGNHYYVESSIMNLMKKADTFSERIRIMEEYMADRIDSKRPLLLDYCINSIINNSVGLRINELAQETGYSDRYIRKVFEQYVGFSPKTVSEIVRFQKAFIYLERTHLTRCEVSVQCGYYDQSHMNRAFHRFSDQRNLRQVYVKETIRID